MNSQHQPEMRNYLDQPQLRTNSPLCTRKYGNSPLMQNASSNRDPQKHFPVNGTNDELNIFASVLNQYHHSSFSSLIQRKLHQKDQQKQLTLFLSMSSSLHRRKVKFFLYRLLHLLLLYMLVRRIRGYRVFDILSLALLQYYIRIMCAEFSFSIRRSIKKFPLSTTGSTFLQSCH